MVNGSKCGYACDFKFEIIEYQGNNCFIPTKRLCFVKCVNYLTGLDYKQQFLQIIRIEKDEVMS